MCTYEVHRPFIYSMKTNMEMLESEENGGMWREKPSGLLARVGHRPPCYPAATETCANNLEANACIIIYWHRLRLYLGNAHYWRSI